MRRAVSYKISHNNRHKYSSKHYIKPRKYSTTFHRMALISKIIYLRKKKSFQYISWSCVTTITSNTSYSSSIYYTNNFLGEKRLVRENLCKCLGVPNLKFEIRALLLKSKQKFCWKDPRKIIPLFNERMMTIMIIIIIINCSSYICMRNVRMYIKCVMCERLGIRRKYMG